MSKIRISKKLTEKFPAVVVAKIIEIAASHNIKTFDFDVTFPGKVFVIGEGDHYTGIDATGKEAAFEAIADHNVGASGLTHKIGQEFFMPAGSFLIRVSYYSGYYMTVYQISPKMITA